MFNTSIIQRPRRLRKTTAIRSMVQEHHVQPSQLIAPLFIVHGKNIHQPIPSLPGIAHLSPDEALKEATTLWNLGIPAVLLFGVDAVKDEEGTAAYDENGMVHQTILLLKKHLPHLYIITDICLCAYTSHGHCGVLQNGNIENDSSLLLLAKMALSHAKAGADMVAPSDMMDGRIGYIREALDDAGFQDTGIMSYAAKYASAWYGPFRDAAHSSPQTGDRKTYQMQPANSREAIREVLLDAAEGADIVMIKPAAHYLDIIYRVKQEVHIPVAAYQVSGEYASIKIAAANGWMNEELAIEESLVSIKRAGADLIITYFAKQFALTYQQKFK